MLYKVGASVVFLVIVALVWAFLAFSTNTYLLHQPTQQLIAWGITVLLALLAAGAGIRAIWSGMTISEAIESLWD